MNIYFIVAVFLLFLLSFAHATWGEKKIFRQLKDSKIGERT